jgi:hypothetical protein
MLVEVTDPRLTWDLLAIRAISYEIYASHIPSQRIVSDRLNFLINPRLHLDSRSTDYLYLDFNQYIVGSVGWHPPEFINTKLDFQWTSDTVATLPVRLDPQNDYRITFLVFSAEDDVRQSLKMDVNGIPISLTSHQITPEEFIYEGIIPETAINIDTSQTLIEFTTDRVSNLSELGLSDTRMVGIAFDWLEITRRVDE